MSGSSILLTEYLVSTKIQSRIKKRDFPWRSLNIIKIIMEALRINIRIRLVPISLTYAHFKTNTTRKVSVSSVIGFGSNIEHIVTIDENSREAFLITPAALSFRGIKEIYTQIRQTENREAQN